jgi:hypothetical protein
MSQTSPIRLTPLTIPLELSLSPTYQTILEKFTHQISGKRALAIIDIYKQSFEELQDILNVRIVDVDDRVIFSISGSAWNGSFFGPKHDFSQGFDLELLKNNRIYLKKFIISDNAQRLQINSTDTKTNTICVVYDWVPNPHRKRLERIDLTEVTTDIHQLEKTLGDVAIGGPFYQVGDYRKVGR